MKSKDQKRLDFLQANPRLVGYAEGYGRPGAWTWRDSYHLIHEAVSLREAIDAAMASIGGRSDG